MIGEMKYYRVENPEGGFFAVSKKVTEKYKHTMAYGIVAKVPGSRMGVVALVSTRVKMMEVMGRLKREGRYMNFQIAEVTEVSEMDYYDMKSEDGYQTNPKYSTESFRQKKRRYRANIKARKEQK